MRLRKEEVEAMRLLIAAEYDDEDDYIQAVWNGVVDMLSQRDSYGVGVKMFGRVVPYGPFYDVRRAKKYGSAFAGAMRVEAFVTPLTAPSKLEPKDV